MRGLQVSFFVFIGSLKLEINNPADLKVFDESDGTEIDDDDILAAYDKGSTFTIGEKWEPVVAVDAATPSTITIPTPSVETTTVAPNASSISSMDSADLSVSHFPEYDSWLDPEIVTSTPIYSRNETPKEEDDTDSDVTITSTRYSSVEKESQAQELPSTSRRSKRVLLEDILNDEKIKKQKNGRNIELYLH